MIGPSMIGGAPDTRSLLKRKWKLGVESRCIPRSGKQIHDTALFDIFHSRWPSAHDFNETFLNERREAGSSCHHSPRVRFDSNSIRACPFRYSLDIRSCISILLILLLLSFSLSFSLSLCEMCVCVFRCLTVVEEGKRAKKSKLDRVLRIIAISRPFWFRIADVPPSGLSICPSSPISPTL